MTELGGITEGDSNSAALDINDQGQIVGYGTAVTTSGSNQIRAVLWRSFTSPITKLGPVAGEIYSYAQGINNRGQIEGYCNSPVQGCGLQRAFIWDSNHGMRDLTTLIDPEARCTVWFAMDINDAGQIVGWGAGRSGYQEAVLLTPIP